MRISIIPCLVCYLLTYASVNAQDLGVLKGVVFDSSTKESIPGANIYDIEDMARYGVTSDVNGKYQLQLSPGKHTIICSFMGMKTDTIIADINEFKVTGHDFLLLPAALELQTMVISAGKFEQKLDEITVSMEVIKPSIIENKNSTNVKEALEQTPGLNILDGEPQIRGGSGFNFGIGSRVAILIDGLPALGSNGGPPEWNFIPVENVEQIEIIKGASSVTYGSSALSGSINVRTAYPKDDPVVKVSAYSGIYDAPSVEDAKWWTGNAPFYGTSFLYAEKLGQNDLVVGGMNIYDHGFIGPPDYHPWMGGANDTSISENEVGEKTGRLNFNWRYRLKNKPGFNFGINGNFMKSTNNISLIWGDDTAGIYRAFPNTMGLQDQMIMYLDPFINFYTRGGLRHSLRTRYFYTKTSLTEEASVETNVAYSEYQFIKQLNFFGVLNITGGIIMNRIFSRSELAYNDILPENKLQNFAGYAQLDKKIRDVLNVSIGFRNEIFIMNDDKIVSKPIFRSGLNYQLAKATFLRYSYGQGYRFPTITEKYLPSDIGGMAIFPNPILKPESSWNTEVGVKQGFKINNFTGFLDGALFWQEYANTIEFTYGVWDKNKDIIGEDSLSAGFKYLNTGDTRVRGAEVSLSGMGKISKDFKIEVLGGYTYVLPQAINPSEVFAIDSNPQPMSYNFTSTDTTNNVLKYRFQHHAKLDLQLTYRVFSIGGSWRYYSFIQNIDQIFYLFEPQMRSGIEKYREEHNKGVQVFDARIGVEITKKLRASFIVNNLLNLSYSLRPLKIESPRTYALRITINFS